MKSPDTFLNKKVTRRWIITRFGVGIGEMGLGALTRKFTDQSRAGNIMIDVGLVTFLATGTMSKYLHYIDPIVAGIAISPLSFYKRLK